jgi:hypothetical protein
MSKPITSRQKRFFRIKSALIAKSNNVNKLLSGSKINTSLEVSRDSIDRYYNLVVEGSIENFFQRDTASSNEDLRGLFLFILDIININYSAILEDKESDGNNLRDIKLRCQKIANKKHELLQMYPDKISSEIDDIIHLGYPISISRKDLVDQLVVDGVASTTELAVKPEKSLRRYIDYNRTNYDDSPLSISNQVDELLDGIEVLPLKKKRKAS